MPSSRGSANTPLSLRFVGPSGPIALTKLYPGHCIQTLKYLVMCEVRLGRRLAMTTQRTIELSANGRNRRTHQIPLALAALVLGLSTIVAGAQSFTNTSRAGGSRSAPGVGVLAAPQPSTTLSSPPASALRSVGVITAPQPSTTPPSPVVGRPLNQLNLGNTPLNQGDTFLATPVGPLPPVPTTVTTATSGGSSGIPLQGGGLDTLEGCISFWDRATHMTKAEWKAACQRSIVHREEIQKSYQKLR